MSRWIEQMPDGTYHEEVYDTEGCRWLYDEVCCNEKSPFLADFPCVEEDCKECAFFEKEEMEECSGTP